MVKLIYYQHCISKSLLQSCILIQLNRMIVLLCSLLYLAQASLSPQIPILSTVVFQSQIQDYSISQEMMRRGEEKFAPRLDKQFYVRHWELHMHDSAKEAQTLTRSEQPTTYNKFISPELPGSKTDDRWLYGYGILLIFALLVIMQRSEVKEEQQHQVSFEEEEYELAATKH